MVEFGREERDVGRRGVFGLEVVVVVVVEAIGAVVFNYCREIDKRERELF